jgi:hypothetical protein
VVKWRGSLAAAAVLLGVACAPRASVVPGGRSAPTVFRVRAKVSGVVLSGTMTGWRPLPLERADGAFELRLELAPGRYEYRLEALDSHGIHAVFSEGAERTDDGFGGENAVLRIR